MEIRTLTPVHVSSGNKLTRIDFIVRDGKVFVLDTPRLFEALEWKDVMKLVDELSYRSLVDIAKEFGIDVVDFRLYYVKLTGSVGNEILEQIKTEGRSYIPGSSIKGAIRTAILWHIVKNDRSLLNFAIRCLEELTRGKITHKTLKMADDKLERRVFGKDPRSDFMRALRVTDSTPFDKLRVYEVKILGSGVRGVCVECIDENDTAEIDIKIDEFTNIEKFKEHGINDVKDIVEITRDFSLTLIEKELGYDYSDKTKSILKGIKNSRGMLLRVGWGTGWYSKTIGLLLENHPNFEGLRRRLGLGRSLRTKRFYDVFPKTRRVTVDGKPLGWICIDSRV
ncbi:MAG: type III-A CRISPR-associated RAMP protein Csm5 [Archaeoglobales archaeon]|nr:MAG: type III-A CRISPR-associated RAMP protein Csm5 [Archaeoglobales archaeon]